MRTPILRFASIAIVFALAACEKEQTTPPTDGDAPVADEPAGDTAAEPATEEPKEGGW